MGVAIGIIFALASLLVGFGLISKSSIDAIDQSAVSRTESRVRLGDQRRTELTLTTFSQASPLVDFTVKNSGQFPLHDFDSWDVLLQYYEVDRSYNIVWLPYTTALSPGNDQWTVTGLYVDAVAGQGEIFQPNVLDPGEEAVIRVRLNPAAYRHYANQVTFVTPNGVALTQPFQDSPTLYVLDATDPASPVVYWYNDEGGFMKTTALTAQNADSKGITTDKINFWTTDKKDDTVYKYSDAFSFDSSWAQGSGNADGDGITTNGTNVWIVDKKDKLVYKYDMSGNPATILPSFALTAANRDGQGITVAGTKLYVVDDKDDLIYVYNVDGTFDTTFALAAANVKGMGITTDGTNIWVVDETAGRIYKYDMTGTPIMDFALQAGNTKPRGITVTAR